MDYMQDILAVDSNQALWFFYNYLRSNTPPRIAKAETLYVASILAHYAQTSRFSTETTGPAADLYGILDTFVIPGLMESSPLLRDSEILEIAGSQTLLLVGFFRDQASSTKRHLVKHNLKWYDELGKSFFLKASAYTREQKKYEMLWNVSEHFIILASSCLQANRTMREERYLLHLD